MLGRDEEGRAEEERETHEVVGSLVELSVGSLVLVSEVLAEEEVDGSGDDALLKVLSDLVSEHDRRLRRKGERQKGACERVIVPKSRRLTW